jgi:hypothetical protein
VSLDSMHMLEQTILGDVNQHHVHRELSLSALSTPVPWDAASE